MTRYVRKRIRNKNRYKRDSKNNVVDNENKEKKFEELMVHVVEVSRRRCGPVGGGRGYNMVTCTS